MDTFFAPSRRKYQPRGYQPWYDHIIDQLLVDPRLTQKEIARRVGRSMGYISTIMNSDLFRARYEFRRNQKTDQLNTLLNSKLTQVAITSLDLVQEQLEKKRDKLPFEEVADVMDTALQRLGYGVKASGPAVVVNNQTAVVAPISSEDLAAARAKIVEAEKKVLAVEVNAAPLPVEPAAGLESKEEH